jgi:hypothetical protein
MARRRATNSLESISPAAAKSALLRLIAEGRVTAAEVTRSVMEEVESLRERLEGLLGSGAAAIGLGRKTRGRGRKKASSVPATAPKTRKRRKQRAITPERRAAMAVQGQYLALTRKIGSNKSRAAALKKAYKAAEGAMKKAQVVKDFKAAVK